ncbi:hypothetical protein [Amycolatopsis sp. PS_44_ISF1]|uniref:hypothetical protein n=1 Tax=Amycolatopsis sp. PS_44_ISF1 TaxID=2974917 RepID=UPI0028DD5F25|nr:hypothetical protein [Amycolatopsis sp. PS_44_ISF1]MDT8913674.1 hypothetical protein [Amycolatopsis sp. PS_44_ISF1]
MTALLAGARFVTGPGVADGDVHRADVDPGDPGHENRAGGQRRERVGDGHDTQAGSAAGQHLTSEAEQPAPLAEPLIPPCPTLLRIVTGAKSPPVV